MYDIDFKLLKKVKELGHCLCNLEHTCPCHDFINSKKCKCGVFKQVKKDE